jgi:hypothetical protein
LRGAYEYSQLGNMFFADNTNNRLEMEGRVRYLDNTQ